jgi:hypothetical protein
MIRNIFSDKDGTWSWRKIMTGCALFCFMIAVLGNLIVNDFKELPVSYWGTIAGVFVFYFFKNSLGDIKISKKEEH